MRHKRVIGKSLALALILVAVAACSPSGEDATDQDTPAQKDFGARIIAADSEPQNWLSTGRTYSEQHYSPLDGINRDNVGRLGLAWYHEFDTDHGQEGTPLVIDGVLYVETAWNKVFAFDGETGELLWSYDPKVPGARVYKACCGAVSRGIAAWDGKIYVGAFDGRLIALDAKTGKVVWSVQTFDTDSYATITGAPRVVEGLVVIGFGGADYGERGYVTAYDAETGEQIWRFYLVPGDPSKPFESPAMEMAAKTWTGEWWKKGGGGTVWDSMAYDPDTGLLYLGVGNGHPFLATERSPQGGDNLFVASIVAVKAGTGEYVWHYQTTPAETWDYTATQLIMLVDIEIDGVLRKVLVQAPKNGFFYVLDRVSGELLGAKPFVETRWATHIDMETGRPVEVPFYREFPFLNMPGLNGGHNWQPMAWSPKTGLVYLPIQELQYPGVGAFSREGEKRTVVTDSEGHSAAVPRISELPTSGHLVAWNPATLTEIWRVTQDYPGNGGVLATAGGLVFQGQTSGTFSAYDAATGEQLWDYDAVNGIMAAPIAYAIDGVEYVAVLVGYGGGPGIAHGYAIPDRPKLPGRLFVFRLDGDAVAAPLTWHPDEPLDLTGIEIPEGAQAGDQLFLLHCARCHGIDAVAGMLPDLRFTPLLLDRESFNAVVLDGTLTERGMVGFTDHLSEDEVETIRAYLLTEAATVRRASADSGSPP